MWKIHVFCIAFAIETKLLLVPAKEPIGKLTFLQAITTSNCFCDSFSNRATNLI